METTLDFMLFYFKALLAAVAAGCWLLLFSRFRYVQLLIFNDHSLTKYECIYSQIIYFPWSYWRDDYRVA